MDWRDLIAICEADLRAARGVQVVARLRDVKSTKVPRKFALAVANISRRSSMITLALRILAPLHLPNRKSSHPAQPATPQETAEYAVCLQRFGAVTEARGLLESLDSTQVPEALLYLAFCNFNQWRYTEAVPLLRRYLESPMDEYSRLVGRTNLAAALVATGALSEADDLIARNLEEAQRLGVRRLKGNNYELRAQVYLQQKNYGKLRDVLDHAHEILKDEGGFESAFVRKWGAIASAFTEGKVDYLRQYRAEVFERQDWENVRDADRYLLQVKFDAQRFNHLVFGTPNEDFRRRLYADFNFKPESDVYICGSGEGPLLDIGAGTFDGKPLVEVGQRPWQLLFLLSRDLYKPVSIGELFSHLYADERFNVFSSPARIHQLLSRLRETLRAASVPVQIVEQGGNYSLRLAAGASILLTLGTHLKSTHDAQLEEIKRHHPLGTEFSSRQGEKILNLPETTMRRFLRWGLESGHLLKLGSGYNTRYMVTSPHSKAINHAV